jgi:hypothetical protein
MGLQFENLVLGSRARIREALALDLNTLRVAEPSQRMARNRSTMPECATWCPYTPGY